MTANQRPEPGAPPWLDRARQQLDAEAEHVDAARLERARRTALAQLDQPRRRPALWWGGGVAGAATCVLLAVLWGTGSDPEPLPDNSFADSDLLGDLAEPEFFDELEFYHWLARED